LERTSPTPQIHYLLGEVYTQKKMRKKAIEQYEKYLKLGAQTPAEEKMARDRLQALKRGRL
jgi:predicted negative regulator of RcsB-dependent stress response